MKTFKILTLALALFAIDNSIAGAATSKNTATNENAVQPSQSSHVTISYAALVEPADSQGNPVYMAAIGGTVRLRGTTPAYVTLRIGGQTYTALTDRDGIFSFFVYANNSSRFEVEAWLPESDSISLSGTLDKTNQ